MEAHLDRFFRAFHLKALAMCGEELDVIAPNHKEMLMKVIQSVWTKENPRASLILITQTDHQDIEKPLLFLKHYFAGVLFYRAGKSTKAISHFLQAEKCAFTPVLKVEVLLERATISSWLGQISSAQDDLIFAIALMSSSDYRIGLHLAWLKLGQLEWEKNNYVKALNFLTIAKQFSDDILLADDKAKLDIEVAQVNIALGQYDDANQCMLSIDSTNLSTYHQFLLILLQIRLLGFCESVHSLPYLLQVANELSDKSEWQNIALKAALSSTYLNTSPSKALVLLEEIETYFTTKQLSSHLWRCLVDQVRVFCALNQDEKAIVALEKARNIALDHNNRKLLEKVEQLRVEHDLSVDLHIRNHVSISHQKDQVDSGYLILKELGRGGYGIVFHAFDTSTQNEVALKTFEYLSTSKQSMAADVQDSLHTELRLISKLSHPGVIAPKAFGKHHQYSFYIVSDYIEGTNLRVSMLASNSEKRSLANKISILFSIVSTLHYVHSKDLAHCDIKPENILIDRDQKPYLIDFGSASLLNFQGKQTGISGTQGYLAPEVIKRGESSAAQDVFAISVLAYEFITGRHPFEEGLPLNRLVYAWRQHNLSKALLSFTDNPKLNAIIMAGLSYSVSKRATISDILAALEAYSFDQQTPPIKE